MSTTITDLVQAGFLEAVGWTMLLAVWMTGLSALVCAAWLQVRAPGSAARHRAIVVAYACSAVLVLASPLLLRVIAAYSTSRATSASVRTAPMPRRGDVETATATSATQPAPPMQVIWTRLPRLAALCWIVGSALLLARVGLGWIVARRIRRRAQPIGDHDVRHLVATLSVEIGIPQPDVLVSGGVEAPVVVGAFRPAIILPGGMTRALTSADIAPLVAHELAHIRRRDYALNFVQSLADALFFFNPGMLWLSRRLREAREFSCDDHAVRSCGDPARYARALTAMAALGTARPLPSVLGATGPRLLDRVRRLLRGETRPRWTIARAFGFACALSGAAYASPAVARLSSHGVAAAGHEGSLQESGPKSPADGFQITAAWAFEQPGAYVTMTRGVIGGESTCHSFTVTNNANVGITELTFVAIVESRAPAPKRVRIVMGQPIAITVLPQSTMDVSVNLLSTREAAGMVSELGNELQVMCGLARTVYENGSAWETRPNPAARSGAEALNFPPNDLPRRMISLPGPSSAVEFNCRDEKGAFYSEGALVQVRNEPGTFAECRNGRWIDWKRR